MSARDEILGRIRTANAGSIASGGSPDGEYAAIPRDYLPAHHDPADTDVVALFAERAADYRAVVERVPAEADLPAAIARALSAARSVAVPDGLPDQWLSELPAGTVMISDESPSSAGAPLSPRELDAVGGVLTGCAVAIAETGTVVLDHGPGQGRRALTLVPDFHLVVVRTDQVAADLPDGLARLDPRRPVTFISGPSATSDIELIRVEGVHGPRKLHVVIAG